MCLQKKKTNNLKSQERRLFRVGGIFLELSSNFEEGSLQVLQSQLNERFSSLQLKSKAKQRTFNQVVFLLSFIIPAKKNSISLILGICKSIIWAFGTTFGGALNLTWLFVTRPTEDPAFVFIDLIHTYSFPGTSKKELGVAKKRKQGGGLEKKLLIFISF